MSSMNISISAPLKEFVIERVAEGGYSTASEYFRELVRKDQEQRALARVRALIEEGLNSKEPPVVMDEVYWAAHKKAMDKRKREYLAAKQKLAA